MVGDLAYENQTPADGAAADPLTQAFDQAREAFANENFDDTLKFTNQALAQAPRDAAINEFRNLVMQPDSGGTMLSTIALKDDRTLVFAPIDGGNMLTFTK